MLEQIVEKNEKLDQTDNSISEEEESSFTSIENTPNVKNHIADLVEKLS